MFNNNNNKSFMFQYALIQTNGTFLLPVVLRLLPWVRAAQDRAQRLPTVHQ